jgi:hypothetical protein
LYDEEENDSVGRLIQAEDSDLNECLLAKRWRRATDMVKIFMICVALKRTSNEDPEFASSCMKRSLFGGA